MRNIFFIIIATTLLISVSLGLYLKSVFYGDAVTSKIEILIRNEDLSEINNSIIESQILPNITNNWAFKFYAKYIKLNSSFKAGRYIIEPGMSVIRVARLFKLAEQTPVNITFNNIRTPQQLAGRIAEQLDLDSLDLVTKLQNNDIAKKYGFDSISIMSMFIPNTYELYWSTSSDQFIERMSNEYHKFWNKNRLSKLSKIDLTPLEAITLASIVYEETKMTDEMPRVAGVYINRLRIGMPLQADPTVKFALQDFTLKRILHKHLEYESPYNTYLHQGLPPSPICMPSIRAIDAVLNYEKHSYLYFCARATLDGYHNFATTYGQHLRYAKEYSNALNRLKIK